MSRAAGERTEPGIEICAKPAADSNLILVYKKRFHVPGWGDHFRKSAGCCLNFALSGRVNKNPHVSRRVAQYQEPPVNKRGGWKSNFPLRRGRGIGRGFAARIWSEESGREFGARGWAEGSEQGFGARIRTEDC
jgi:hypothetical protein